MSDLQLRIRAAREDDAAAVAAIYRPYVRDTAVSFEVEPPSPAVMAQRIQSTVETHPWLIAENGVREIVGYVYAGKHRERPAYRWSVDTTIYIDQTRRRAGIGSMLYDRLLRVLRRQGFRSAFAEIVCPIRAVYVSTRRWGLKRLAFIAMSASSSVSGTTSAIGGWAWLPVSPQRLSRSHSRPSRRFRTSLRCREGLSCLIVVSAEGLEPSTP